MSNPIGAPGCYGSVIAYDPLDTVCAECRFFDNCGEVAYGSLDKIRESLDVTELAKKFERHRVESGKEVKVVVAPKAKASASNQVSRKKLTPEQLEVITNDSLPKKPRVLIGTLYRKGITPGFILQSIRNGVNPFRGQKPLILEIMCDHLIAGTFIKKQLFMAYQQTGMSKGTASSQVSIVVTAFSILEIIDPPVGYKVNLRGEV